MLNTSEREQPPDDPGHPSNPTTPPAAVPDSTAASPPSPTVPGSDAPVTANGLDADDRADATDLADMADAASAARAAEAAQLRALGGLMRRTFGHATVGESSRSRNPELELRSLRLEVAARLHLSEYAAEKLMHTAHHTVDVYKATLAELAAGRVSLQVVHVNVDEGLVFQSLPPEQASTRRAQYEAEVIPHAHVETPNRLRPIAHRIALELADLPLDEQHESATRRRCVQVRDLPDGMAEFAAYLPATAAYAIRDRVAQIAKHIAKSESPAAASSLGADGTGSGRGGAGTPRSALSTHEQGGGRTRSQIEADLFTDLLLTGEVPVAAEGSAPIGRGISGRIQVVVPAHRLHDVPLTDTESTGDPAFDNANVGGVAELVGYGPIGGKVARETAERAAAAGDSWDLVNVTVGGTVMSVKTYRPSAHMRRFIIARDLHCRAPGCRRQATSCDIDHTIDAAHGGATSTDNLASLCRGHHVLKHTSGWRLIQHDAGALTWVSPTGAEHTSRAPSTVRFRARTSRAHAE